MEDNQEFNLIKFQENIFKQIHEMEKKILERVVKFQDVTNLKLSRLETELQQEKARTTEHNELLNTYQIPILKIPQIEKDNSTNGDELFSLKWKLIHLEREQSNFCKKYDKIVFENLILPGTIGTGSKFQNLREYLNVRLFF